MYENAASVPTRNTILEGRPKEVTDFTRTLLQVKHLRLVVAALMRAPKTFIDEAKWASQVSSLHSSFYVFSTHFHSFFKNICCRPWFDRNKCLASCVFLVSGVHIPCSDVHWFATNLCRHQTIPVLFCNCLVYMQVRRYCAFQQTTSNNIWDNPSHPMVADDSKWNSRQSKTVCKFRTGIPFSCYFWFTKLKATCLGSTWPDIPNTNKSMITERLQTHLSEKTCFMDGFKMVTLPNVLWFSQMGFSEVFVHHTWVLSVASYITLGTNLSCFKFQQQNLDLNLQWFKKGSIKPIRNQKNMWPFQGIFSSYETPQPESTTPITHYTFWLKPIRIFLWAKPLGKPMIFSFILSSVPRTRHGQQRLRASKSTSSNNGTVRFGKTERPCWDKSSKVGFGRRRCQSQNKKCLQWEKICCSRNQKNMVSNGHCKPLRTTCSNGKNSHTKTISCSLDQLNIVGLMVCSNMEK